jgi:hypothetical protein
MIMPRHAPPGAYVDDPADTIDRADRAESVHTLVLALASEGFTRIGEWITRGRGGARQRALRSDIVLLCICPHFLCKRPSAAWVARQHDVSRQRASLLQQEFVREFGDHLQFRGQRFRSHANMLQKRRGRVRRGAQGPQPGPVVGV